MRIKIGSEWHDSSQEPVCIEISDQEKIHISRMDSEATKYASAPDGFFESANAFRAWME